MWTSMWENASSRHKRRSTTVFASRSLSRWCNPRIAHGETRASRRSSHAFPNRSNIVAGYNSHRRRSLRRCESRRC